MIPNPKSVIDPFARTDETEINQTSTFDTFLISRIGDGDVGVILHIVHTLESPDALLTSVREFLKEWGKTDEGKEALTEACDDFNWGDFAEWSATLREKIPGVLDIQWVYPAIRGMDSVVIVDHDELLLDT